MTADTRCNLVFSTVDPRRDSRPEESPVDGRFDRGIIKVIDE